MANANQKRTRGAAGGKKGAARTRRRTKAKAEPTGTVVLAVLGVLLALLAYVPGQTLWAAARGVLFGVFGVSGYVLGFLLLYLAWLRTDGRSTVMYLQAVLSVLLLSAFPIVFSSADYAGVPLPEIVTSAYTGAVAGGWHGGVSGCALGGLLATFCGRPAANILLILFLLGDIYLFFPVSPTYLYQKARSLSEDGREHLVDTREKRAEAARRSAELQAETDARRAARLEREAALAAPRRQTQVDIDLGPDAENAQGDAPAAQEPDVQPTETGIHMPDFSGIFGRKKAASPEQAVRDFSTPVEPEHIEIGPGGTFGMNPLSTPVNPTEEPDISGEIGGEFETHFDFDPSAEPGTPGFVENPAYGATAMASAASAAVPQPGAFAGGAAAPAPDSAAGGSELDSLIQKAADNVAAGSAKAPAGTQPVQPTVPEYRYPPLSLLERQAESDDSQAAAEMRKNADILVKTLESFGVRTKILDICRGPSVTRYELQPLAGVKISRITSLADDIALNLAKAGVRIEAPIPGKPAVGIEVPNDHATSVSIRGIFESQNYISAASPLTIALGKDIAGSAQVTDLRKMPHLLIAGSTGSGKSVCVNSIIISFLYRSSPEDVKLILIDPKVVELAEYNGIPHLLMPVVTEPRKAAGALGSAVAEMERRYHLFAENNVRDIKTFNRLAMNDGTLEKLPYIAIVIDELADLMMVSGKEVEDYICRIAQKARAAGMHLIVATQRPSVDVITGLIKANIPSRIAFAVSSQVDSRTILDGGGAEKLLGMGDMLFLPVGAPKPIRIQGTYVKDEEISAVLDYIKKGSEAQYDESMIAEMEKRAAADPKSGSDGGEGGGNSLDPMFEQAVEAVIDAGQASTSMLQRRCKLGYARAARIMDEMEQQGIIGPYEGAKPRQVLIGRQQWIEMKMADAGDAPESEDF